MPLLLSHVRGQVETDVGIMKSVRKAREERELRRKTNKPANGEEERRRVVLELPRPFPVASMVGRQRDLFPLPSLFGAAGPRVRAKLLLHPFLIAPVSAFSAAFEKIFLGVKPWGSEIFVSCCRIPS